jgi:hypothetical protein
MDLIHQLLFRFGSFLKKLLTNREVQVYASSLLWCLEGMLGTMFYPWNVWTLFFNREHLPLPQGLLKTSWLFSLLVVSSLFLIFPSGIALWQTCNSYNHYCPVLTFCNLTCQVYLKLQSSLFPCGSFDGVKACCTHVLYHHMLGLDPLLKLPMTYHALPYSLHQRKEGFWNRASMIEWSLWPSSTEAQALGSWNHKCRSPSPPAIRHFGSVWHDLEPHSKRNCEN